jgi:hypothetical protein
MATTTPTSVPTTGPIPIYAPVGVTLPGTGAVVISNLGANNVFLGGPAVTATTGVQLAPGAALVLPSVSPSTIYAIAVTAAATVVVGTF